MPVKTAIKGFSLVELSIVILIAAIFASSMINILGKRNTADKASSTQEKMAIISEALKIYWQSGNRHYLPCPALLKAAPDDVEFGYGLGEGDGECYSLEKVDDPGGAFSGLYIGAVPVIELGLPTQYMFDAWGNKIVYAVGINLTSDWFDVDPSFSNITIVGETLDINVPLITRMPLKEEVTAAIEFTPCTRGDDIVVTTYEDRIPVCPAFLLLSHGANGYMAHNAQGTVKESSFGMSDFEFENDTHSDGSNRIFVSAPLNMDIKASGLEDSTYFDDLLYYKSISYFTGAVSPASTEGIAEPITP